MKRNAAILVGVLIALNAPSPARAESAEHCAFRLVPVSRTGSTTSAAVELIGCYPTYEEAVEAGSGGSVDLAEGSTPDSLLQEELETVTSASSDVLIGTEWGGPNYTFASNSYFASETCSASNTWQVSYVGDTWNDRFESGKGFGGCDTNKKFQHADFAGSVLTCTPNCTNYGSLADEVSSLRWKP
jgi:hypothetical protein